MPSLFAVAKSTGKPGNGSPELILKACGKRGVPQGVISPLLSNIYLNEIDKMLERAKEVTRRGKYTYIEYARFAEKSWCRYSGDGKYPPVSLT